MKNISQLLELKNGTPSYNTLFRVFSLIDSKKFLDIFISWIKEIINDDGVHLSIDGKAVKSVKDDINGGNTPYIIFAFLSDIGISIGQVKIENLMK